MQCMNGPNNLNIGDIMSIPTPQGPPSQLANFTFDLGVKHSKVWYLTVRCMNSKLPPAQVGRMLYFLGKGELLIGIISDQLMQFVVIPCIASQNFDIQERLLNSMKHVHNVEFIVKHICDEDVTELLQNVFIFSLRCELVRSGLWIAIGKGMDLLTTSDILKYSGDEESKNIPVIKLSARNAVSIDAEFMVYKFYPLHSKQLRHDIAGSRVCVLPNLVEAVCIDTPANCPEESRTFLRDYWINHYGFVIPEECLHDQVRVTFPTSSIQLTYPAVCVWKYNWCFLPRHTREYGDSIAARFRADMGCALEMWNPPATFSKYETNLQGRADNTKTHKRRKLT